MSSAPVVQPVPNVEFHPETHTYIVGGEQWPSVTQVLESAGLSDYSGVQPDVLERAQKRGSAVHKATWFWDQSDLDLASVSPAIIGYVNGWLAFRDNTGFVIETIEQIVTCSTYKYCGTYDRRGYFPDRPKVRVKLDIKTGDESPSWKYQLAGYSRLEPKPLACERLVVRLFKDGTYKLFWYPLKDFRQDEAVFVSAVNLWWAKRRDGLI